MPSSILDGNPPAHRLGRQLRRVRVSAGYTTQAALGKRIGWGEDTVSKAETGVQVPTDSVFIAWIEACRVHVNGKREVLSDGEVATLTDLWEVARLYPTSIIPDLVKPWFEAEAEADAIYISATTLVPGIFQTEPYAQAMYDLPGMDEGMAAATVSFRMHRQAILHRDDPVQVRCVLHEAVLYLLMGTPQVMVGQIDRLLEVSLLPSVTLQVSKGKGAYWGLAGPFQIASGLGKPDILVQPAFEDQTTKDVERTRRAAILFEKIRANARNAQDSRADMMEAREHWNSQQ